MFISTRLHRQCFRRQRCTEQSITLSPYPLTRTPLHGTEGIEKRTILIHAERFAWNALMHAPTFISSLRMFNDMCYPTVSSSAFKSSSIDPRCSVSSLVVNSNSSVSAVLVFLRSCCHLEKIPPIPSTVRCTSLPKNTQLRDQR